MNWPTALPLTHPAPISNKTKQKKTDKRKKDNGSGEQANCWVWGMPFYVYDEVAVKGECQRWCQGGLTPRFLLLTVGVVICPGATTEGQTLASFKNMPTSTKNTIGQQVIFVCLFSNRQWICSVNKNLRKTSSMWTTAWGCSIHRFPSVRFGCVGNRWTQTSLTPSNRF